MSKKGIPLNSQRLVQLRHAKGWTQEQLASKAGIDQKTVENAEGGRPIAPGTRAKLAKALGVEPEELLTSWKMDSHVPPALRHHIISFDTLIDERSRDFVGREFLIDSLDQFLDTVESGYFALEAPPGLGKSALMALLIKKRGFQLHHFNVACQGICTTSQFLGNICTRLIHNFNLPYTELPPDFQSSSAFLSSLLRQAVATLEEGERLVVIIDALDEADAPQNGQNILCLPSCLPAHVFFIVTARDFKRLKFQVNDLRLVRMEGSDPRNVTDIRAFLTHRADNEVLGNWIRCKGISQRDFVDTLAHKSQGNFMYLRYVLPEIENGKYTDLDLDVIPAGLESYYEDHWRRMGMTAKPLPRTKLNAIYFLSKTQRPVSCQLLAEFTKDDSVSVQDTLDEWRPFLNIEIVDNAPRYSLYHASFRDFLYRKDIVQAAGINLQQIDRQISDDLMGELWSE